MRAKRQGRQGMQEAKKRDCETGRRRERVGDCDHKPVPQFHRRDGLECTLERLSAKSRSSRMILKGKRK